MQTADDGKQEPRGGPAGSPEEPFRAAACCLMPFFTPAIYHYLAKQGDIARSTALSFVFVGEGAHVTAEDRIDVCGNTRGLQKKHSTAHQYTLYTWTAPGLEQQ